MKLIRNNLEKILNERSLKVTKVVNDTGISRNTITKAIKNDGEIIHLETINRLCQYLEIAPSDFFSYIPFDFQIHAYLNEVLTGIDKDDYYATCMLKDVLMDLYIQKTISGKPTGQSFDLSVTLKAPIEIKNPDRPEKTHLASDVHIEFMIDFSEDIKSEAKLDFAKLWTNDLWAGFKRDLQNKIISRANTDVRRALIESNDVPLRANDLRTVDFQFELKFLSTINDL